MRTDSVAPAAPQYIENGLIKGRLALEYQLSAARDNFDPTINSVPAVLDQIKVSKLLVDHNLILVPSDKNLGCALITKEWFLEQAYAHLANPNSYRKISETEAIEVINEAARMSLALAGHKYVLIKDENVLKATPRFYIIPKIHKSPWKGRPIVPAHSAVHSPAAKLVSMMLKPLVNRQPYIIRGSKEFIQSISAIRFYKEERNRIFIVGGDIEAYYPNVPKGKASQIVKEMMDDDPRQSEENFGSFFEECLDVANSTVVMRFQDDWYVQTDGLSMGVAHAPDMANLYGSYYENKIIPALGSDILYYGRYIDDVFFIVHANNADSALKLCQNLVIDGVNIIWEPAKQYGVFLDVRLWIGENSIGHRPHQKIGNHLERVPWISSHPLDVKKGTFMGELSRLATLCSDSHLYYEACTDLRSLYIHRGYPSNLVNSWYNTYASRFWQDCLNGERPPPRDVQVLRSVFNQVWEFVDISAVQDAVREQWDKDLTWARLGGLSHVPPTLNKPLLVARKRTMNLGDLVSRMRKIVLDYNDVPDELGREVTDFWKS
ncbi:reverse transcriptase [Rhizoctonia solani 123E]|uniref:Reverse transcriptase n=1 Tax=Rhizoctonia solani 123E TaxID=1423351 RepID=A0A074RDK1_9AGAM|nr:reverse transcriptase [Rhizoctonia solani 123E]